MTRGEVLRVRAGDDGLWRWCYVGGAGGPVLQGSRPFLGRQEAVDSARAAFPGVAVDVLAGRRGGDRPGRGRARMLVAVAAGTLLGWLARSRRPPRRPPRRLRPGRVAPPAAAGTGHPHGTRRRRGDGSSEGRRRRQRR